MALLLPLLCVPDCQILPTWAEKGVSWKAAIQMCFCSQHPAVDSSAISLTSSSPDSWSILEQGCAQSHLLLHAGDPGTRGLGQCRVHQALGSCSCSQGRQDPAVCMGGMRGEAASSPGKPPHTHSCRPWLLLPGVRCNKGDELPQHGQHTLCGLPLALGSQNFFFSLRDVRLNKTK